MYNKLLNTSVLIIILLLNSCKTDHKSTCQIEFDWKKIEAEQKKTIEDSIAYYIEKLEKINTHGVSYTKRAVFEFDKSGLEEKLSQEFSGFQKTEYQPLNRTFTFRDPTLNNQAFVNSEIVEYNVNEGKSYFFFKDTGSSSLFENVLINETSDPSTYEILYIDQSANDAFSSLNKTRNVIAKKLSLLYSEKGTLSTIKDIKSSCDNDENYIDVIKAHADSLLFLSGIHNLKYTIEIPLDRNILAESFIDVNTIQISMCKLKLYELFAKNKIASSLIIAHELFHLIEDDLELLEPVYNSEFVHLHEFRADFFAGSVLRKMNIDSVAINDNLIRGLYKVVQDTSELYTSVYGNYDERKLYLILGWIYSDILIHLNIKNAENNLTEIIETNKNRFERILVMLELKANINNSQTRFEVNQEIKTLLKKINYLPT